MADHIEQGDVAIRLSPALHFLFFAGIGQLLGAHIFTIFCNQTVAIDGVDALASFLFRRRPSPA